MAFIPTANCIKLVLEATQNSIPIVNVWHIRTSGSVTDTMLQEAADALDAWVITSMLPVMHSSWIAQRIVATDVSVEGGNQYIVLQGTGYEGQVGGTPFAANAAAVISWRTARIGRSFRGRTYIGGIATTQTLTAQTLTTGYVASLAALGASLIDALETAGFILSVLSLYSNKIARVAGLLTTIISIVVDNKVDSQRKRTAN